MTFAKWQLNISAKCAAQHKWFVTLLLDVYIVALYGRVEYNRWRKNTKLNFQHFLFRNTEDTARFSSWLMRANRLRIKSNYIYSKWHVVRFNTPEPASKKMSLKNMAQCQTYFVFLLVIYIKAGFSHSA